jgi:hypothetical protein
VLESTIAISGVILVFLFLQKYGLFFRVCLCGAAK